MRNSVIRVTCGDTRGCCGRVLPRCDGIEESTSATRVGGTRIKAWCSVCGFIRIDVRGQQTRSRPHTNLEAVDKDGRPVERSISNVLIMSHDRPYTAPYCPILLVFWYETYFVLVMGICHPTPLTHRWQPPRNLHSLTSLLQKPRGFHQCILFQTPTLPALRTCYITDFPAEFTPLSKRSASMPPSQSSICNYLLSEHIRRGHASAVVQVTPTWAVSNTG